MIVWSVSQSSAWQCPRQWWFGAMKAIPAQPEASNRVRGRAIHAAIEHAYHLAQAVRDRPLDRTPRFMIEFIDPALEILWKSWGFARFHGFAGGQAEFNTAASQLTELFLTLPIPRPSAVLGIEKKATLEHADQFGTYKINCVLDLVLRTGATSAHIRDWKSGRIDDNVTENVQLAVYDLAARTLWPWLTTVTVGLYSVRENRETTPVELTAEDRASALSQLLYDANDAHATMAEVNSGIVPGPQGFPTAPGERCSSCVFRSYCPEFDGAVLPIRGATTPEAVATERTRLVHRLESVNR